MNERERERERTEKKKGTTNPTMQILMTLQYPKVILDTY